MKYILELSKFSKREILFIDEHGKNIVYEDDNYQIAVDDPIGASYITLWYKDTKWTKVGYLSTSKTKVKQGDRSGLYMKIDSIEIDPKHRNKGYGKKLYEFLSKYAPENVKGIYSYLPDRINNKEIPNIYKSFKSEIIDDDHQFIDF